MAALKFDFRSILTKNLLDEKRHKGTPFTFVHCRDTKQVFFTDAEGNYIDFGSILAAVMNGTLPLALPASPVAGPQGPQGLKGDKGENGVGWQGARGEKGEKGDKGDVFVPTDSELSVAIAEYRSKYAKIQAALLTEIEQTKDLHPHHRAHLQNVLARLKREIL
jgi:hypothetical protein